MRRVKYGSRWIDYTFEEKEGLKAHYISINRNSGVRLKGTKLSSSKADQLILKKAGWITKKLDVVKEIKDGDLVTGSRLQYLGKSYYVQVLVDSNVVKVGINFNHSKFVITVPDKSTSQKDLYKAVAEFYKNKAEEKLIPRVNNLSAQSKLKYQGIQIRKMKQRWGSCTGTNKVIFNPDMIKLPYSLIDYVILHELTHTKVKDHSRAFWSELAKHCSNWKIMDDKLKNVQYVN